MARVSYRRGRPPKTTEGLVRMGQQGRIVLPRKLCNRLGLVAGRQVRVDATGDGVLLTPVSGREELLREMRTRWRGLGVSLEQLLKERRREARLERGRRK
jgi:bifunctional DNA-binding transcriptional regulator/antitoxin component of YhaV-PrlF toxin-antitoxin module